MKFLAGTFLGSLAAFAGGAFVLYRGLTRRAW